MSSRAFTHFLFLVGLNFINLYGTELSGPASFFAEKWQAIPAEEFYDIAEMGGTLWVAGDGLYAVSGDAAERVLTEGRYSSLLREPGSDRLWFATADTIGYLRTTDESMRTAPHEGGFIWAMEWEDNRIWYFGSLGFGWIDPGGVEVGRHWPVTFSPRPFVSRTSKGIFIGSYEGLWRVSPAGIERVLRTGATQGAVNWVEWMDEYFLLGTSESLYRWSGQPGAAPLVLDTNYDDFFKVGINNAIQFDSHIAVTDYPFGVALLDPSTGFVNGYIPNSPFLNVGDIFKVKKVGPDQLFILGQEGIGRADVSSASRFFAMESLLGGMDLRQSVATTDGAFLFTDSRWIEIGTDGYQGGTLGWVANWVDLDPDGHPVLGAVTSYETLRGDEWIRQDFPKAVTDLSWGEETAYAVGEEGIYKVSDSLGLELIYRTDQRVDLIGEFNRRVYAIIGEQLVISLLREETGTYRIRTEFPARDRLLDHGVGTDAVWLATPTLVYKLTETVLQEYPVATGWRVSAMTVASNKAFFVYLNAFTGEIAIGASEDTGSAMLSVRHLPSLGEPREILGSASHLGIVGSAQMGWYAIEELERIPVPRVSFDLLFEDKRVEDRTIPSGMHFIDLQVNFHDSTVPSLVQYRINEQRWRNVNLQDPSMQFAGHGTFTVELRAMHPNGNTSPVKMVQFGIAPPWYLNPLYQGIMLLVLLLIIWGLFYLRSAQLKRTNLWLQKEVKKQTRELEAATAARTNFLAGLSHDIRNPLNGVLMIAETLSRHPPTSGEDPRLRDLTEFGVIVDRMLGEILDFSAIDQRNIPTAYIPVSITDIIHSSIKQNQFGIQKEMVTINQTIAPEVEDVIIRTDRNWMIKILTNLIVNALEYAETDRIEVGVSCGRLTDHEVDLEFYVADYGKGIDDSEKELVFERFYRGESGIESGKHGTGLGLSICQEIAHAMGAHLSLAKNEPTGCRFILKGRFDRVEDAKALDKEAVLDSLKGKRILVVDDLVYNRRSIVEFFQTIGSECDEAENGHEALALLEKHRYYLALLDWDLPGLTGPEIARRHRKNTPDDPVILIAVTAYTDGEKKRESEEAGMNGYISKPLTAVRLAYCLANIEDWKPREERGSDVLDADEVQEEIYKHIDDCLLHGERYEWEELRRCAHRLTTLAMIRNNQSLQQVCRDLQVSAKAGNIQEIQVGLLELQQWKRT